MTQEKTFKLWLSEENVNEFDADAWRAYQRGGIDNIEQLKAKLLSDEMVEEIALVMYNAALNTIGDGVIYRAQAKAAIEAVVGEL